MYSKELLKGTLRTVVMELLARNEKMYGYEITQKVKELTNGKIVITEGALYPLLHKLEADGLVSIEKVAIGKRIRKYYSLTDNGSSTAQQLVEEFADFVATMKLIIDPPAQPGYGTAIV
ncbi:MAG: PadR family transcriptional regulator [Salibacteraceae bacterium]